MRGPFSPNLSFSHSSISSDRQGRSMINSLICKVSKNVPRHLSGSLSRLKHGFDSRGGHQLIRSFSRIRGHLYRSGVLALSCVHCVAHVNYDHRLRDQHRGTDLTVNRNNAVRTDNFLNYLKVFLELDFWGFIVGNLSSAAIRSANISSSLLTG